MGRKKKFQIGDVVWWWRKERDVPAVVVDYKQDTRKRGRYRVVRVMHPFNGHAYGEAVWAESGQLSKYDVENTFNPYGRPNVVLNYKANLRFAERGCSCQCCVHEAVPRSLIMPDGTYKYEETGGEE